MDNLVCFEDLTPEEIEVAKKAIKKHRWDNSYPERARAARNILITAFEEVHNLGIRFYVSSGHVYSGTDLESLVRDRTTIFSK